MSDFLFGFAIGMVAGMVLYVWFAYLFWRWVDRDENAPDRNAT